MKRRRSEAGRGRGKEEPGWWKQIKKSRDKEEKEKKRVERKAKRRRESMYGPGKNHPRISYAQRAGVLKRLGYASYREYLDSDLWAGIKKRVFARDNGLCHLCNRPAIQVHHKSYGFGVLAGFEKDLWQLASVCGGCHVKVEFDRDMEKRDGVAVGTAFRAERRVFRAIRYGGWTVMKDREPADPLTAEFFAIVGLSWLEPRWSFTIPP